MNILVTGSNGQLGNELRNLALSTPHHFIFTDVDQVPGCETVYLDITNSEAVDIIVRSEKVDVIINCAAYTNVEKAEDEVMFANTLNAVAPANLARAAKENGAVLIHISTDYIFNSEERIPIREDDEPSPTCVYGSTKLSGEIAVRNSGCDSIIIRTSWLYSQYKKNFVKTMAALLRDRDAVSVVNDQIGTPTYATDLATAILVIAEDPDIRKKLGVYHYSNEGCISWYDFTLAIRDMIGSECIVNPCTSEQYPQKARRPSYSVLDKTKIRETFGVEVPDWKDSLFTCISLI